MSWVKSVVASLWIGWYRDFGWTNPFIGLSLKTVSPVASVLTVTVIYSLGSVFGGAFDPTRLAYVMVGSALYAHIATYSSTANLAVAEGKWNYVFPHVYISPRSSAPYVAGRALASFFTSGLTTLLSLIIVYSVLTGVLGREVPLTVNPWSVLMVIVAMVLNIPATLGIGYMLASYSLLASKFEWALPTYISGVLMIFSEALFPVSVLPWPFSAVANVLPFTQFMRASREALIFGSVSSYMYYLGFSILGGVILLSLGLLVFRLGENRGRKLGIIDKKVA
jgi:ABC-2 type transport system permease protein